MTKAAAPNSTEEQLHELLDFAAEAGLAEVVWEKGDRRVAFKRGVAPVVAAPAPAPAAPAAPAGPKLHVVKSPMVGTFQRAAKDRPPLVLEGSEISAGQKMGVVEAMNIPKDVLADVHGRIVKILVENGKPVEYGQPLFEVEVTPEGQ
ncbi:MAG: acetyl-CoA carboxylase biotin carboxyl carrier protein [Elusimicrobia bacterium]|nr:acetyl-CoA carboxylase biotin carboxyl carrier protein [Elusimicrobiota bacterium]